MSKASVDRLIAQVRRRTGAAQGDEPDRWTVAEVIAELSAYPADMLVMLVNDREEELEPAFVFYQEDEFLIIDTTA